TDRDDELADGAFLPAFDFDRGFGGFDYRHDLAASHFVAGFDQPFVQGAFVHIGAKGGHFEFDHCASPKRLCTAATILPVWARAACSRCFAYGMGTSALHTRATGASRS